MDALRRHAEHPLPPTPPRAVCPPSLLNRATSHRQRAERSDPFAKETPTSDTESGITPTAELAVDRKEFADALRILERSVKVARVGHCTIGYSEGNLVIRIGGAVVRARASGY